MVTIELATRRQLSDDGNVDPPAATFGRKNPPGGGAERLSYAGGCASKI
jgi:hypothetical protein